MNLSKRKYLVIVNPRSGKGISSEKPQRIKRFLNENGVPFDMKFTSQRGDAEKFASGCTEGEYTHVVSVGGDGTSSEIVNAIANKKFILSIIPSGSGNDFPKAAGIPVDFDYALENILTGKEKKADIGKFADRCFINGLGIGLDGAVAKRFSRLKIFGGFAGYLIGATIEALIFRGFQAEVISDHNSLTGNFVLLGASNGPTQGGIRLAPEAKISDNLLDFHFISDMAFFNRLDTLGKALKAKHLGKKGVKVVQMEKAELITYRDLPAHRDGEVFELKKGRYSINIMKDQITILAP